MIFASNFIESAFSPLIKIFEGLLVFLHGFLGNWGLAIVGMTIVIRAALIPLTWRQLKSMQAMQQLAPELQALKAKYKDDKQRQQQEVMKLYQERGVNPFSSCLPLLLQLPVFFSLFYMLRTHLKQQICGPQMIKAYESVLGKTLKGFSSIPEHATTAAMPPGHVFSGISHVTSAATSTSPAKLAVKGLSEVGCNIVAPGSAKFLFLPDITERAFGISLIVLIVLYVGSQVASTLVATATADPTQRRIMLVLPIIFVIILYKYPSGLLLYWITTNLWTVGQQLVIRRRMPPPPPPPMGPDGKPLKKPGLRQQLAEARESAKAEPVPAAAAQPAASPPPPRKKKKRSGRRR